MQARKVRAGSVCKDICHQTLLPQLHPKATRERRELTPITYLWLLHVCHGIHLSTNKHKVVQTYTHKYTHMHSIYKKKKQANKWKKIHVRVIKEDCKSPLQMITNVYWGTFTIINLLWFSVLWVLRTSTRISTTS